MDSFYKMGDDLIVSDSINDERIPFENLKDYCLHIICYHGKGEIRMNDRLFVMGKNNLIVCPAGTNISDIMISPDFKGNVILLSGKYLDENSPDNKLGITGYLDLINNPVIYLNEESVKTVNSYFETIRERLSRKSHSFIKELIRCLIQAFIYDVWDICYSDPETSALSLQGTTLFERFLFLAERHCISEREVRYYSSRLNITPKYLSAICKKTSGKTASEWIEVFTIQQICVLLKNKNLSIKEISERMNFSTQSFFGRYVQRLLGVSPSEYRSVQENKI